MSVALGRRLFKVRGWIYIPFAAAALLAPWGRVDRPGVLWPAGLALVFLGILYRFSCIRRMGGAARTHKHKAKRLVATGPYAWVRNPLYIANTAAFLGFVLLCGHPWLAAASAALLWAYYHAIARYEETVLRETFGEEFEEYRRRVPLWIPRRPRDPPPRGPLGVLPRGEAPAAGARRAPQRAGHGGPGRGAPVVVGLNGTAQARATGRSPSTALGPPSRSARSTMRAQASASDPA